MTRLEFSRSTRDQGNDRCAGKCEMCDMPFNGKRREFHHILAANDGGDNTLENMLVLCVGCHKPLTRAYTIELRKAERIHSKHNGAMKPTSRPMPGGRNSPLRKKMDGSVVQRK